MAQILHGVLFDQRPTFSLLFVKSHLKSMDLVIRTGYNSSEPRTISYFQNFKRSILSVNVLPGHTRLLGAGLDIVPNHTRMFDTHRYGLVCQPKCPTEHILASFYFKIQRFALSFTREAQGRLTECCQNHKTRNENGDRVWL